MLWREMQSMFVRAPNPESNEGIIESFSAFLKV